MLRLLADENLNANIVRGLRRGLEALDLISVQSLGLTGADDRTVLAFAAEQQRVLVTQDIPGRNDDQDPSSPPSQGATGCHPDLCGVTIDAARRRTPSARNVHQSRQND